MRTLEYLFRSSSKQEGFDYGRAARPNFLADVIEGDKKESTFITENIDDILEKDRERSNSLIKGCQETISQKSSEIEKMKSNRDNSLAEEQSDYNDSKEALDKEEESLNNSFENIYNNVFEQLTHANTTVNGLVDKLKNYVKSSEEYLNTQENTLKKERGKFSLEGKKELWKGIKDELNASESGEGNGKEKINKKEQIMNVLSALFLLGICLYDVFFGYPMIRDALGGKDWVSLWVIYPLLTAFFVPLILWSVHFLSKIFGKKAISFKNLGLIALLLIILIVILYVLQSMTDDAKFILAKRVHQYSSGAGYFLNELLNDKSVETILRALIIPSMLIGEIVIELTNWDLVFSYFGNFSKISNLIIEGIGILNKRKLTKRYKDEINDIEQCAKDAKSILKPDYSSIENDMLLLKSIMNPLYSEASGKDSVYLSQLNNIKARRNELELNHKNRIDEINNNYNNSIADLTNTINNCNKLIAKSKKEMSTKENELRAGFVRGLGE